MTELQPQALEQKARVFAPDRAVQLYKTIASDRLIGYSLGKDCSTVLEVLATEKHTSLPLKYEFLNQYG